MKPSEYYHKDLQRQGWQPETGQLAILELMDSMHGELVKSSSLLSRFRSRKQQGLYIHGGVGRGKTYLLDIFHQSAPAQTTLRMHFHSFMRDMHQRLQKLPKTPNPMPIIARQIARKTKVLCLDELFVDDIADAMLLVNLLPALSDLNVRLITTSNIEPERLYENGLQRMHFMQAIDWLKEQTEVVNLDHDTDFRYQVDATQTRVFPGNDDSLEQFFHRQLNTQIIHRDGVLMVQGREIPFLIQAGSQVMFDFHTLCATSRSVLDYLELAENYNLLAIKDVCMMGEQQDDVAKRFMHLVDALYDNNVALALSVEAPLQALYQGRRLQHNFIRTLSRLYEMTSDQGRIALS